jgi:three-Cys-motif partner protein
LQILRDYLGAFTTTTKNKAAERIYLDLFAGQTENIDRVSGEPFEGSAQIAIETGNPPFTRIRLFELEHTENLEELAALYPERDIKVIPGDCNETIAAVLDELQPFRWAPTFAFVDPAGPDFKWETLAALAGFKSGKYKVEQWILFPTGMLTRLLRTDGNIPEAFRSRISDLFGSTDWEFIYDARVKGDLSAAEARSEYVNLMRWRLENELGYQWTHSFEVRNEAGQPLHYLIFATDNEAGNRIMQTLYGTAAREFPRMRDQAREIRQESAGIQRLFPVEAETADVEYAHEPPVPPYGSSGR